MTNLQESIIRILSRHIGEHTLGPDLATLCGCHPRHLRTAIRSLRFDHNRWDILSHAGGDGETDGYWISEDKAEIADNRVYHEIYGKGHLARASRMTPAKSEPIADAHGQLLMFEVPG